MKNLVVAGACILAAILVVAALPGSCPALSLDDTLAIYRAGDYRVAADRLERLKAESPEDATIRYYLGYAYYKLRNYDRAREEFAQAYELSPRYSPILTH